MQTLEQLLTVAQVAKLLGLSPSQIYRIAGTHIPVTRLPGTGTGRRSELRFKPSDVEKYLAKNTTTPDAPAGEDER